MNTRFIFLILPEVHLMDLAGPAQTLHEAIEYGANFQIEYCNTDDTVVSSAGLPIPKIKHFSQIEFNIGDFLMIPGADMSFLTSEKFKKNTQLKNWILSMYKKGVKVCSICSGAFVLAECGILDNVSCTTHFKRTEQLQDLYPKTKVQNNILFTQQNGIYTSAGIASGIDLTLHIIEELKGSYFSHLVARELVVYNRRNGLDKQQSDVFKFRNHIHSGIHKVQDWIIENIKKRMNLGDLADIAGMSERNFTRIFRKETGVTVNDYITQIRKEKINELLKNPDLSRPKIASEVGLKSERQVSRLMNINKQK